MADNTAEVQTKLRSLDNLLQHGHPTSHMHNSIMLPGGPIIFFCNNSLRHLRIWTRNMFRLRPSVGTAIRLIRSSIAPWNNQIFLLCTRASNKHPLLHETLHACLTHFSHQLLRYSNTQFHLPIFDPVRSINLLPTWYATLRDHFAGQNIEIILHDRVYVSIASETSLHTKITEFPSNSKDSGLTLIFLYQFHI